MSKLIKDLFLAMLNATLLLIALCLVLGLMVVNRANSITETFATNLIKLEPVKDEVVGAREDIAALRTDLADLKANPSGLSEAALNQLGTRVDAMSERMDGLEETIQEVKQMPYDLTEHAIETAADRFGQVVAPLVANRADQ